MAVYVVIGSQGDLVANDPTDTNKPKRFQFVAGGWAARVNYVPRVGESLLLLGTSQAIEAATGMPTTTLLGIDPNVAAGAVLTNVETERLVGSIRVGLPADAALAKTDVGKLVEFTAGKVTVCNATTDRPIGVLAAAPDAPAANTLCEVALVGLVKFKGIAAGVTQADPLVIGAAGAIKTAVAADFLTSNGASPAVVLGTRAIGFALETAGANVDFLGFYCGMFSGGFLT